LFTNPLPLALILLAFAPAWWPLPAVAMIARVAAAWSVAGAVLHDPLCARRWWLVPVEDLASFAYWLAGFFGNTITWRGRTYFLKSDGRFERIA
jgi:ceramide glucosyltransferase